MSTVQDWVLYGTAVVWVMVGLGIAIVLLVTTRPSRPGSSPRRYQGHQDLRDDLAGLAAEARASVRDAVRDATRLHDDPELVPDAMAARLRRELRDLASTLEEEESAHAGDRVAEALVGVWRDAFEDAAAEVEAVCDRSDRPTVRDLRAAARGLKRRADPEIIWQRYLAAVGGADAPAGRAA